MKNLMLDLNLHFTDSQVQSHVLAIHGATKSLMLAIINKQPSASLNDIYALIIRIALSEFSLPPQKNQKNYQAYQQNNANQKLLTEARREIKILMCDLRWAI